MNDHCDSRSFVLCALFFLDLYRDSTFILQSIVCCVICNFIPRAFLMPIIQ